MRSHKVLSSFIMVPRFHKHKLLLDENMSSRLKFPRLNGLFNVKHIRDDLHVSGISDPEVFTLAKEQKRLIVTLNGDDFRHMAEKSPDTGIISVSDNLRTDQVDSKLTALLVKSSAHALQGKFTALTGRGVAKSGIKSGERE